MADINEIKYLSTYKSLPGASSIARRALNRNPQAAYFYHVLSSGSAGRDQGLQMCKKGLQCEETTPFVRSHLLRRAVEHAGELSVSKICSAMFSGVGFSEGIALATSAFKDTEAFLVETSPENRHTTYILSWHVLLTLALRGDKISPDLHDFAVSTFRCAPHARTHKLSHRILPRNEK